MIIDLRSRCLDAIWQSGLLPFTSVLLVAAVARGQASRDGSVVQLADRGPIFYVADGSNHGLEIRSTSIFRRRVSIHLKNVPLTEALDSLSHQSGLSFGYASTSVAPQLRVSLRADDITVASALNELLLDTGLDVSVGGGSFVGLTQRNANKAKWQRDRDGQGSVVVHVVDAETKQPLKGAAVSLRPGTTDAVTSDSGIARFKNLASGNYTVRVRMLGYTAESVPVTIADSAVRIEMNLPKSPLELDQVVVTGTVVPTEVRALPTPITVISDSEVAQQQPHTVMELFRQFVPTGVSFDVPVAPYSSFMTVRGSTDLDNGGSMKVLIDGIETTSGGNAPVDPESIDHIEVIRGPEAAAIYGSGAIDGVMQIFTKRGSANATGPQFDLQAAAADVQTPYAGFHGVLRQKYSGDVRGGNQTVGYSVGGSFDQTGNFMPAGEFSAMSTPSAHGAVTYHQGIATLSVSARYYQVNAPPVFNPLILSTGLTGLNKPAFTSAQYGFQTIGANLTLQPTTWWHHSLSLGYDENSSDNVQRKPRFTTATDSELSFYYSTQNKRSIAYNTSATGTISRHLTGTLTLGADYWQLPYVGLGSFGVFNTTGSIQTDTAAPFSVNRTTSWNTGAFAQAQVGIDEALFLTVGARAEWDSDWGDSIGTPISPRLGASYVHTFGNVVAKLRASWGSALIAPFPTAKEAQISAGSIYLGNPHLGPEHQHGGDVGLDLSFGARGSFGATYYNQKAINLIQTVNLPSDTIPTSQSQNVGTLWNSGIELEGTMNVGRMSLHAVYGFSRSKIESLAPGYTGDLRIGDQALDFPKNTAGLSATFAFHGTSISAGVTYVGSWTDYDNIAEFHCFSGTGPCPASFNATGSTRAFLMSYPSLVKGNFTITQQLGQRFTAFLNVDNVGDDEGYERSNINPVFGRITTIGLRFHR